MYLVDAILGTFFFLSDIYLIKFISSSRCFYFVRFFFFFFLFFPFFFRYASSFSLFVMSNFWYGTVKENLSRKVFSHIKLLFHIQIIRHRQILVGRDPSLRLSLYRFEKHNFKGIIMMPKNVYHRLVLLLFLLFLFFFYFGRLAIFIGSQLDPSEYATFLFVNIHFELASCFTFKIPLQLIHCLSCKRVISQFCSHSVTKVSLMLLLQKSLNKELHGLGSRVYIHFSSLSLPSLSQ